MQPLSEKEKSRILATVESATSEDIEQYEALLARRFMSDPAVENLTAEAIPLEQQIAKLHAKLFPTAKTVQKKRSTSTRRRKP